MAKNLEPDKERESIVNRELDFLDEALKENEYLTGDCLTLADLFVCSTVTLLELIEYNIPKWPNLQKWLETIKSKEFYVPCNMGHETWKIVLSERKQMEFNEAAEDADDEESSIEENYNEDYKDNYNNSL